MAKAHPDHKKNLAALKRIEGQLRGIHTMVEDRRYCVDILTQLSSVIGAVRRVQDDILERHVSSCVASALKSNSKAEKTKKVNEVVKLLKRFNKNA